jgi:SPW repeat
MRLSTRMHGYFDYALSAALIGAPWLLGLAAGGAEKWVLVGVGVAGVLYSLFTDYELGLVRRIQMPVHLWLDGVAGVVLAASPWLFEFDDQIRLPHIIAGVLIVVIAFFTNTIPGYERRGNARAAVG